MNIIMSIKNKLIKVISKRNNITKNESPFNITNSEVKIASITSEYKDSNDTIAIAKNPFILTAEDFKKIAQNYDSSKSKFSVSVMNDWQKYKNPYSRTLMQAKRICRQHGK
ncbi:hypothetical protein G9F71_016150 [Clostridium sp. FP2]|uniref:hypothetical protein n=1 Tax=Clostridium sp. FP2 TaxID=2724481 RepID=UPI0013E97B2A|nr:hypothetical protein [Clostridium sp. FP2]MBZ9624385.1 hypothetical protein [Clostridium sp. FP2]